MPWTCPTPPPPPPPPPHQSRCHCCRAACLARLFLLRYFPHASPPLASHTTILYLLPRFQAVDSIRYAISPNRQHAHQDERTVGNDIGRRGRLRAGVPLPHTPTAAPYLCDMRPPALHSVGRGAIAGMRFLWRTADATDGVAAGGLPA